MNNLLLNHGIRLHGVAHESLFCFASMSGDSDSGFGGDVAVSGDGQRIIIGAQDGNYYAGFSRVYEIILAGPTSSPSQLPSSTSSDVPSISITPSVSPSVSAPSAAPSTGTKNASSSAASVHAASFFIAMSAVVFITFLYYGFICLKEIFVTYEVDDSRDNPNSIDDEKA